MPSAEAMEANLSMGFRSIQACATAKRINEDAKQILAWKAQMMHRALLAARGVDVDKKPGATPKSWKGQEVDLELRGRIRVNKGLEDMLQRNEAERHRALLADFEEETRARAHGHVLRHHDAHEEELNTARIHLDDTVPG